MKDYTYKIGIINRSCGHKEDAGIIKSSCAYEPTARKWELEKKCKTCKQLEYDLRTKRTNEQKAKGEAYVKAHNIKGAYIQPSETGCEVTVYL